MKIKEIIEKIKAYHPAVDESITCDGYKSGNGENECTGIVSALLPTMEVIKRTIKLGANLLIVHEPTYYLTPDFPEWRGDFENAVQREKRELLEKHHITIWRDHDRMHAHVPDTIFSGVMREFGWEAYYRPELADGVHIVYPFELPRTTVGELGAFLKEKLSLNGLRYIGNATDQVTKVIVAAHLYPNSFPGEGIGPDGYYRDYATLIMRLMEKYNIEAVIPGEIIEWNLLYYIRDAVQQGKNKACFNIGHFNLEELGMKVFADTLKIITNNEMPVTYVPSEDGFSYL